MNLLTKLLVLVLSISLVSCASNTQKENTVIGVGTGALIGGLAGSAIGGGAGQVVAIGAGAIAGAVLGGYIGHSMDSSDKNMMNTAMNNPRGQTSSWTNSKTGATYSITPTTNTMTINGNPNCRKYSASVMMDGKKQRTHGIACMQSNGVWHAIN